MLLCDISFDSWIHSVRVRVVPTGTVLEYSEIEIAREGAFRLIARCLSRSVYHEDHWLLPQQTAMSSSEIRLRALLSHLRPALASSPAAPPLQRVLIANRGEISIRIARCCTELGIGSVAVCATDEAGGLARHTTAADACAVLPGRGVAAYLNQEALLDAARKHDCDAVAPGYGFLSENTTFVAELEKAGVKFIGK